jgi:hypothetical protein
MSILLLGQTRESFFALNIFKTTFDFERNIDFFTVIYSYWMKHSLTSTVSSIASVACVASTGDVSSDIRTYSMWVTGICQTFVCTWRKIYVHVSETSYSLKLMRNFRNIDFVEYVFKKYANYCLLSICLSDNTIDLIFGIANVQ